MRREAVRAEERRDAQAVGGEGAVDDNAPANRPRGRMLVHKEHGARDELRECLAVDGRNGHACIGELGSVDGRAHDGCVPREASAP